MTTEQEYRQHFNNALFNYAPILSLGESKLGEKVFKADKRLVFPESPEDALEYLGNIDLLEFTEGTKTRARRDIQEWIKEKGKGARWIWYNKFRLKMELKYLENFQSGGSL